MMRLLLLLIIAFSLSVTKEKDIEKLTPLQPSIEISECLVNKNSPGACTVDDMTCWTCENSGSNTCCQFGYEKCYYWLTVIEEN